MNNIHPEAKNLINPELASPKYYKSKVKEENLYHSFQVLAGTEKHSEVHSTDNDISNLERVVPHIVQQQDVFPISRKVETSVHDLETHLRLDKVP